MTSPFNRTETAAAPQASSPFGQKAPEPAASITTGTPAATPASRFAVKRERPDKYPTALDLMPSTVKGTDGALVIIRVESVKRDLPGADKGTYDAYDTKTWILDAPRSLPQHVLEAGEERDGAYYLPEMRWSGAGLVRDLDGLLDNRQLFVGRVGAFENKRDRNRPLPEFNMATDAELAQAEAYLAAHPEVDFPKASNFARAS